MLGNMSQIQGDKITISGRNQVIVVRIKLSFTKIITCSMIKLSCHLKKN